MTPQRLHFLVGVLVLVIIAALFYFLMPAKTIAPENTGTASSTAATSSITYTTKTITESNSQKFYSLKASYPVFAFSDSILADKINRSVREIVNQELVSYRADFDTSAGPGSSAGEYGTSTLQIDFNVLNNHRLNKILPLRFNEEFYSAGAAHPGSNVLTLNYNLVTADVLSLANLFKPGAQYLEAISEYSIKTLKKNLGTDAEPAAIEEGAAPKQENFNAFLVTDNGLEIIFTEYQVAAYAAGEQEVTIPWSELKDILNPNLNLL
ncbi:MAG TPA: RsiV family protein [Candidatus Paceibacterota bacterium]|nr:RsiV family protein [Candidatus Paceibacterota bacterium]